MPIASSATASPKEAVGDARLDRDAGVPQPALRRCARATVRARDGQQRGQHERRLEAKHGRTLSRHS